MSSDSHRFYTDDCLEWMKQQPDNSVDLVVGSPPYEDARLYGDLSYKIKGEEYVKWMLERMLEMVRISKGLVAMVVEGKTRSFSYTATPILLMADLKRSGVTLRKPVAFFRVGIPGSGGPDWFRNDYEYIICCSKPGQLPYSNNTALGKPPKYGPGGVPSHRLKDGTRVNEKKMRELLEADPNLSQRAAARLAGVPFKTTTTGGAASEEFLVTKSTYVPPQKANPGNFLQAAYTAQEVAEILKAYESGDVLHTAVGGGKMGSKIAHEHEAAFPEKVPEFFVRSCCPPGGVVLDPFAGSGSTMAMCVLNGRKSISVDIRADQAELQRRRFAEACARLKARADSLVLEDAYARLIKSFDQVYAPEELV